MKRDNDKTTEVSNRVITNRGESLNALEGLKKENDSLKSKLDELQSSSVDPEDSDIVKDLQEALKDQQEANAELLEKVEKLQVEAYKKDTLLELPLSKRDEAKRLFSRVSTKDEVQRIYRKLDSVRANDVGGYTDVTRSSDESDSSLFGTMLKRNLGKGDKK
jgi:hypothetical protein